MEGVARRSFQDANLLLEPEAIPSRRFADNSAGEWCRSEFSARSKSQKLHPRVPSARTQNAVRVASRPSTLETDKLHSASFPTAQSCCSLLRPLLRSGSSCSLFHLRMPNRLVGFGNLPSLIHPSMVRLETPKSWATWSTF